MEAFDEEAPDTPESYYRNFDIQRSPSIIDEDNLPPVDHDQEHDYDEFGLEREAESSDENQIPPDHNYDNMDDINLDDHELDLELDDINLDDHELDLEYHDPEHGYTPEYDYDDYGLEKENEDIDEIERQSLEEEAEAQHLEQAYLDQAEAEQLEQEYYDQAEAGLMGQQAKEEAEIVELEKKEAAINEHNAFEMEDDPVYRPATPTTDNDDDDLSQYYSLKETVVHTSSKLRTDVRSLKLKFRHLEHLEGHEMLEKFYPVFGHIMKTVTQKLRGEDYFRLTFESPTLNNPIAIAYQQLNGYDVDMIFSEISKVLQSYIHIRLNDECLMTVTSTYLPLPGGGRGLGSFSSRTVADFPMWMKKKRSIITPAKSNDELCALRCVAIGKAIADKVSAKIYRLAGWQYDRVMEMAIVSELPLEALTVDQLKQLEPYLLDYQLNIFECGIRRLNILHSGDFKPKQINLLLHDEHYYVIRSMKGFQSSKNYCSICQKPYKNHHICKKITKCKLCRQQLCQNRSLEKTTRIRCDGGCNRIFVTESCKMAHTEEICAASYRCAKCDTVVARDLIDSEGGHKNCGQYWCRTCKTYRPRFTEHKHYIAPFLLAENDPIPTDKSALSSSATINDNTAAKQSKTKPKFTNIFMYADFETSTCAQTKHIVALMCVVQSESGDESYCYHGENTVQLFLDLIFSYDYSKTRRIFVFHYGSGFDLFCFLKAIYARKHAPSILLRGTKILSMTLLKGRIRFIDSYCFLQMPLRSMSSAFQIDTLKGRYPYSILNESTDLDRFIDFPDQNAFEPDLMTPTELRDFLAWYQEEKEVFAGRQYHVLSELRKYCIADVVLLRLAFQKFRIMYCNLYGIDAPLRSVTLVGANFLFWRRTHVKPDSVALIADFGYYRTKSSRECAVWLTWIASIEGIRIEGNHNGVEKRYSAYIVDGHSLCFPRCITYTVPNPANETIFFYMGCEFHGCVRCHPDRQKVFMGRSHGSRYASTQRCLRFFEENHPDLNIITEWSCGFRKLLREHATLRAINFRLGNVNPFLKVREALFGGRCEVFKNLHKCKPDEGIYLFDVVSLYPSQMASKNFCIGHPTKIIRDNFDDISSYFGLVYGRFIPPRSLYLPILPCRIKIGKNTKLVFTLCSKCASNQTKSDCRCSDSERSITGIFTTNELALAFRYGYKPYQIFEVWHYDETATSDEIFKDFVQHCIKLKMENSGWPTGVENDPAAREKYLSEYRALGIELDPEKITICPSLKTLAKLSINSLFGRIGMRQKRVCAQYVSTFAELRKLMTNPDIQINDITIINEDLSLVSYTRSNDFDEDQFINIVMAAQITSYSRILLYETMAATHQSGCTILYTDTDSIFLCKKRNEATPFEESDVLGKFKNETAADYSPDAYLTEFISTGPKSYCYIVSIPGKDPKLVIKIKGFKLDMASRRLLTKELMERFVMAQEDEEKEGIEITYKRQIVRDHKLGIMFERNMKRTFKLTNDKRILRREDDWKTYPFGY